MRSPDDSGDIKKPGALARLKSGVGSFFSKMARRGGKQEASSDGVPPPLEMTTEVATADIIMQADAPAPKRKRKTPPPPPVETPDE